MKDYHLRVKKILIPLDFSKTSLKALDHAEHMAKVYGAEILLHHAAEGFMVNTEPGYFAPPSFQSEYENNMIEQSNKHLIDIAVRLKKKGVEKVSTLTTLGRTHYEILNAAKKNKVDMIVMGTHGVSGVREFFLGSNTFRVIRDAKCPVLSIQRQTKTRGFKNILVPFRDRPHSREKVDYAIDLTKSYKAMLHILGVDTEFSKSHRKKVALQAQQIQEIASHKGVACKVKIIENIYLDKIILKHARDVNADIIVSMSSLDREDITEYFTGPFSRQIVNHSPIPVLSIPPTYNPDLIDLRFY